MQGEREKSDDQAKGSGQQQPVGQDSPDNEYGEISETEPGVASEPPRSMGTRGTEFGQFGEPTETGQQGQSGTGQADLGSQSGSTLSGRTDQQEFGETRGEVDQPASYSEGAAGEQLDTEGQGFILQEDNSPNDALQESGSTARATEGNDFAPEGRGALEGEQEDVEGGQSRSTQSDIERQ